MTLSDRRQIFKQIPTKGVLQLLLIETSNDLLRNNNIYNTQLLHVMGVLDQSYNLLRDHLMKTKSCTTGLWKVGTLIKYLSGAPGSAADGSDESAYTHFKPQKSLPPNIQASFQHSSLKQPDIH